MGLVNTVVPLAELEAEGVHWADEILEKSPTAIRFLKSAFIAATDGLAGLQEFAGDATGLYYTTDEAHEGSHGVPREAASPTSASSRGARERAPDERDRRSGRPPVRVPDLAARRAPRDAAGGAAGVSSGSAPALGSGAPLAARHGARLRSPWRCCSRSPRTSPTTSPTTAAAPTRRTARARSGSPPRGLVTERQLEVAIGVAIGLAGVVGL